MSQNQHKKSEPQKELPESTSADVKKFLKNNKAKMLSVAVAVTVGSMLSGCSGAQDKSYYMPGTYDRTSSSSSSSSSSQSTNGGSYIGGTHYYGSYYYGRGSTYRSGSWGSTNATNGYSYSNGGGTHGIGG